ncbi:HAD-IA family hydrolase [Spirulina sp. CCNP1310]|uniref:HAD-IA family hydrolase n=1 Tax=Spirulina sp. CCNP1310 TaxID=3110249 RepID=UPI002B219151|nr:HAD-IA family hydrolase [Spirulina sp. CCNP1310]MEA5420243.1 HAD-IA family hydrolase [Spirulina sp. CCNP1310]
MSDPVILFDFDGTIADTHQMLIAILNNLAGEFGYEPLSEAMVQEFRGLSSQEIIRASKVSAFKIPFLIRRAKEEVQTSMATVSPIVGIVESLNALTKQGYTLGILTSNFEENVQIFLAHHQMNDLFTWLDAGITIFGKHRMLRRFQERHNIGPERLIYVGDETRDIDAAKKSGVAVVSVTWGFNTREILEIHNPDALIDDPAQLGEAIAQLTQKFAR